MAEGTVLSKTDESSEFSKFSEACKSIGSTRSKLEKIRIASEYLSNLNNSEDLRIAATYLAGHIFPTGKESGELNVGYSLIWGTVSDHYNVPEEELARIYLKHGDLGEAIEEYLTSNDKENKKSRATLLFEPKLTLATVNSAFLELSRSSGKGSTERRRKILDRLLSSAKSPLEVKYLVKVMGGELRIGLVEGLVEESIGKAFSKTLAEVRNASLVMGDIGAVALLAKKDKLSEAKLEIFRPTNYMLADTAESAKTLLEKIEKTPVLSEYKYDGIRAQIHTAKGESRIYSRNLEDITRFFPEIEKAVNVLNLNAAILDGEIVPFQDGRPMPFQSLQRRLRKKIPSASDVPVRYFSFDLLFLERSLIEESLSLRSEILHSLNFQDTLVFSEQRLLYTEAEIREMFEQSKSLGYEGLVVKNPDSNYLPGKRGKNWIKLKRELDTLDVVIVAAEYGHGKRAGVISDYTFAVRDEDELKVIGKAYSGVTDSEIQELTRLLKTITLQDQGYRRTVRPQVVLEVAFDAIQKSDRHDSGYALRFPRIKRIRTEKSVSDIDTIEKVKQIYESQKVKL